MGKLHLRRYHQQDMFLRVRLLPHLQTIELPRVGLRASECDAFLFWTKRTQADS